MTPDIALYFRDHLRDARTAALGDAEGFQEILFALERLGSHLMGTVGDLGKYSADLMELARESPLAEDICASYRDWHIPFPDLYAAVRMARNDALHQGAFARHITQHALQLALIVEDALMNHATQAGNSLHVGDYMVRAPVCALLWQPISFIRQQMLSNSFTYLPVHFTPAGYEQPEWGLISDWSVAQYLREEPATNERKRRLANTLAVAIAEGKIQPLPVESCTSATAIKEALTKSKGRPLLVIDPGHPQHLVGILTPFDLL